MKSFLRLAVILAICLFLWACGPKINQENFNKIQTGMSLAEVTEIMGEPAESSGTSLLGMSGVSAKWTDGKMVISVQFFNDKVKLKTIDTVKAN